MLIRVIFFTEKGRQTAERMASALPGREFRLFNKEYENRVDFTERAFFEGTPLIFIGASGIAVRTIAPLIADKLTDPPVLVIDELAMHVIPLLSGHYGGANALAQDIAEALGADPVITTATDINKAFSVDVFARENGLKIANRGGIAKVSTKALAGKPVTISIKNFPPKAPVDVVIAPEGELPEDDPDDFASDAKLALEGDTSVIRLAPEGLVLGIGCRRGMPAEEIRDLAEECLDMIGAGLESVSAIASIDIKASEPGILQLSKELSVPFITFDADLLARAPGEYTASDFVREKTGVDNVCERSAVLAAGSDGALLLRKQARNGITCAVARSEGGKND
ncbi:MAG: cobalt-precorrin 5A hydrolase [Firmicutes bacterium]|nr:cobalt-precorrin 5A hydrolase [Bacillota bacterium]